MSFRPCVSQGYTRRGTFFRTDACRKVGERPPFFGSRTGRKTTDLDAELQQLTETVENRLAQAEPEVELLALERPATERLRLVIDSPEGVDIALCERITGQLR